jgi:methyl-accepting chemotaxis protein
MENRRTIIVINKQFQYQSSLLVAALAVLLVNLFLIGSMLLPEATSLQLPTPYVVAIAAVELLLVAGIWYGSVRATHRIAGPVFVITRALKQLGEGDLSATVELRDTDMFQAEAAQINNSITALREKIAELQARARSVQHAHAAGGDIAAQLEQLESAVSALTTGKED